MDDREELIGGNRRSAELDRKTIAIIGGGGSTAFILAQAALREHAAAVNVDYAEVERRFYLAAPEELTPPRLDESSLLKGCEIERRYYIAEPEGNRKARRRAAAKSRDRRWKIKL